MKVWLIPCFVLTILGGCRSSAKAQDRYASYYAKAQSDGFTDRELRRLADRAWAVARNKNVSEDDRFDALAQVIDASATEGSYRRAQRIRAKVVPEWIRLASHDDRRMVRVVRAFGRLGRYDAEAAVSEETEFGEYLDKVAAIGPTEWIGPAIAWARAHHRVERDLHVEPISEQERDETRRLLAVSYRGAQHLPDASWAADIRQFCSRSMSQLDQLVVGRPAPDIESKDFTGRGLRLSDYRGRIVVLTFWATWCKPCMAKFGDQRELVSHMQGRPFALLGVNSDRIPERALAVANRGEMNWRNFRDDPETGSGECADAFAVRMWPSVFVLDAEGTVRAINPRRDDLWKICEDLVAEVEEDPPIAAAADSD